MSLIAPVEDGKLIQNEPSTKEKVKDGSKMDKDSFLQLLVAQMKYQDPMEPTSNTEYISQYAQFSQVESLQSMSNNMDLQRASSLVGQQVYVKTTTTAGDSKYVFGKVDYVTYEGGQSYLYIDENRYPLTELETIVDPTYHDAYTKAADLVMAINKLPAVGSIDLSDGEAIDALQKTYQEMNDYEKSFIATSKAEDLRAYTEKLAELRKLAEEK